MVGKKLQADCGLCSSPPSAHSSGLTTAYLQAKKKKKRREKSNAISSDVKNDLEIFSCTDNYVRTCKG